VSVEKAKRPSGVERLEKVTGWSVSGTGECRGGKKLSCPREGQGWGKKNRCCRGQKKEGKKGRKSNGGKNYKMILARSGEIHQGRGEVYQGGSSEKP